MRVTHFLFLFTSFILIIARRARLWRGFGYLLVIWIFCFASLPLNNTMVFGSKTSSWPRSHHDVLQSHYNAFEADIRSGKHEPFTYPFNSYSAALVVLLLLFPLQRYPKFNFLRPVAFLCVLSFAVYETRFARSRAIYGAFCVGFLNAWLSIWTFALVVANDPHRDFKRIIYASPASSENANTANRIARESTGISSAVKLINGFSHGKREDTKVVTKSDYKDLARYRQFQWQSYPLSLLSTRLVWCLDLFLNFRGMAWNWRIKGPPLPPSWVQEQLKDEHNGFSRIEKSEYGLSGTRRFEDTKELLRKSIVSFLLGYIFLDLLKVLMMRDPYFWGIIDAGAPSVYPNFIQNSPVLLRSIRLIGVLLGIRAALGTILTLSPLLFVGVLGEEVLGANAEPWIYPNIWGNFLTVLDRGLAGWWGCWWHQTFRFGFESPSKMLAAKLGIDRRSSVSRGIQLFIAFALSGIVHSSGSYTMTPKTYPIRGAFLFFMLQPPAIIFESWLSKSLVTTFGTKLPKPIKRCLTLVYLGVWFYFTGPLICDDFTRGGLWLHEPVPISPLRAIGLGVEGDSWWCWKGPLAHWHTSKDWWKSGIHV